MRNNRKPSQQQIDNAVVADHGPDSAPPRTLRRFASSHVQGEQGGDDDPPWGYVKDMAEREALTSRLMDFM